MKLLITGAGGQLGREFIKAAGGHDVTALDRASLDITDLDAVMEAFSAVKPDIAVNCAAFNDVDGAEARRHEAFMANGIGPKHLALASNEHGSVFVHFSSDYVFGGGIEPSRKEPLTIADRPCPINRYGESKLLGEEFVKGHAGRYFLIRTSWLFGPGENSFPKKLLGWAAGKDELRIAQDQTSSPTYARDLAEAALKLIKTGDFGLYHMTNSGRCSRYEWAAFILKEAGWRGRLIPAKSSEFDSPAKRPAFSVLDNFPLDRMGISLPPWQDATQRFLNP